ncbi:MAG: phosphomethylpyrimidine synthase ThiC [Spirochaetes bacterium]|nr:phosphomethylpyrimidine synthase ThiC [Spirochaetota bacterium]
MTQREYALKGTITAEMRAVCDTEKMSVDTLAGRVRSGEIAIVKNRTHAIQPVGVGKGLSTKVNANLGTSKLASNIDFELQKMEVALRHGADAIMDLSTGGDVNAIRKAILAGCGKPLGTVPLYQVGHDVLKSGRRMFDMTLDDMLAVIAQQAAEGVDFMTIHSGINRDTVARYEKSDRITGCVSRGGAILLEWMAVNGKENPLFEHYDDVLAILHDYDVTISLGDGMRPGSLHDATDRTQVSELIVLGELAERALAKGVQVIIEGPGHVPLNEIEANILLQKKLCNNVPFYVLGPLVTDVAPGYDHITGAIGGAIAATAGADFLCYVTPAEHLKLPDLEDVKEGVVAFKIAAHAADIAKGIPGAIDWDIAMSKRRKALDWKGQFELAMDREKCERYRSSATADGVEECTMCGEFCSMQRDSSVRAKNSEIKK